MSSVWIKRFFIRWEWEEITLPKLIRFNGKSTTYNYLNNLNKDSHFATKFALTPPPSLIIFLEVDIKLLTTSEVWETGRSQTIYRKIMSFGHTKWFLYFHLHTALYFKACANHCLEIKFVRGCGPNAFAAFFTDLHVFYFFKCWDKFMNRIGEIIFGRYEKTFQIISRTPLLQPEW